MLVWSVVDVAVVSIIFWQAVHFNDPIQSEAPASVLYWGERYRSLALKSGEDAPDFCLRSLDGRREVTLSTLRGGKPVVLVFGSYTCPYFRGHIQQLNETFDKYSGVAQFYLIYIKEAHPLEDGLIPENAALEPIPAPATLAERAEVAAICAARFDVKMPILIDDVNDAVSQQYQAWPYRVYVIDPEGQIASTGERAGYIDVASLAATLSRLSAK